MVPKSTYAYMFSYALRLLQAVLMHLHVSLCLALAAGSRCILTWLLPCVVVVDLSSLHVGSFICAL